ncbi:dolichol phosphate-mannose biosynthesis regulatory [Scheffersomyces amazonensis]|uniref:dolichol phosphate-mannose biosynthesis regulatory n=1 Tax=Scheffersomyces amazonensis TaxID=1078765 RepID=UPI00315D6082
MLGVAIAVFAYYSVWVFVLPFVDESSILTYLFLPREYAIKLPLLLLVVAGLGVGTFVGNVLIKKAQKEKLKKSKKSD